MRQAIDQPSPGHFPNAAKIIGVNLVDIASGKLFRASRDAVEHLIGPVQVVNGTEHEIETFPILFHPLATRCRSLRIVIQLEPSADFYVRIRGPQFVELTEIDPGVVAIVIGERDIGQPAFARAVRPRLEQRLGEGLNAMPLGMAVVIGEKLRVNG